MKSVFIAIPTYNHSIDYTCTYSLISAGIALTLNKIDFGIQFFPGDCYLDRIRNRIASTFLDTHYERLLMIDADVGFQSNDLINFLSHDKLAICGLYPKKNEKKEWSSANIRQSGDLLEVDWAATGFLMVHRDAFKAIEPWSVEYAENNDPNRKMRGFFDRGSCDRSAGLRLGEDYSFCERLLQAGIKIYADHNMKLSHSGWYSFTRGGE